MALLTRALRLEDGADTQVFTFVVTRAAWREPDRDVSSREFTAGGQPWAVAVSRAGAGAGAGALGVFLVWRGAAGAHHDLRVYADFTFTLLARGHFSDNESFSGERVRFGAGCAARGRGRCVSPDDLRARFLDARGEFQLELALGRVRAVLAAELGSRSPDGPPALHAGVAWSLLWTREGLRLRASGDEAGPGARWVVRYAVRAGEARSGPLERGAGPTAPDDEPAWRPPGWPRDPVRASLELGGARLQVRTALPADGRAVSVRDADGHAWALRCDSASSALRLHVQYRDVQRVPRNHLRYVSWSAWLEGRLVLGAPFAHYYSQESADEGVMLETSLPASTTGVSEAPLRLRLEWRDARLLFQASYSVHDDLPRRQLQQTRRALRELSDRTADLERRLSAPDGPRRPRPSSPSPEPPERDLSPDSEYA